jgi:hypothetical protein
VSIIVGKVAERKQKLLVSKRHVGMHAVLCILEMNASALRKKQIVCAGIFSLIACLLLQFVPFQ